jgi:hypothetical protein
MSKVKTDTQKASRMGGISKYRKKKMPVICDQEETQFALEGKNKDFYKEP